MTATEDAGEHGDGGHHLPAVEDFPRGFGEASVWPFITAIGGSGIYIGAALFVLAARGLFGSMGLAAGVTIGSIGLFIFGLFGWLYHGFVASFWEREASEQSESKLVWGTYAFLGSEIATFSAGFIYYFFIKAGDLGPVPHIFTSLVIVNTLILLASSFVLHYAEVALRNGNRKRFTTLLGVTLLMGVVFIFGQVYEYYEFIVVEGFKPQALVSAGGVEFSYPFASAFYALTGLHGLHVTLGAVLLGIVFVRALRGQYSAERHVSVKTSALYWHFVDAVWIFLVAAIYIGATAL